MASLGTERKPLILRVQSMEKAQELSETCEVNGWKVIVGVEPDKPEDISDLTRKMNPPTIRYDEDKVGRNDPCPCGSAKKFKKCCLENNI
jgi:SWIM/SEC-C metal-binding protein